jgi:uncharacterized membrane protein
MEYSFFIICIAIVLVIYFNLNNKIKALENHISELQKKLNLKEKHDFENRKEEKIVFDIPKETNVSSQPSQSNENVTFEQKNEKDLITPIFDFLRQNALTIIGIFTLVLGIGYFVKYAIDKNWIAENARVGIGFLIGAIIMTIGHFLRRNYSTFSSIITGGGTAVLYFTITIAFREYHLLSQTIAFSIICLITLISITSSYYYKSEILAVFSLFGGFLAPLMISTGESNYVFLFTYITVLNIGMLSIIFLKKWKSIGWISFIFTSIYLFFWTSEKPELIAILFYLINYIIFYTIALQNYLKKNILETFDILMLVLINLTSTIGTVYIFNELQYEPVIIFPLVFAILNLFLLYKEYKKKDFKINHSVFTGITVSLFTIAFALQFKTHLITSVWAIEATLLLYIWKKTNLNIFKICFYVLFPLVIIAQIITWSGYFDAKNMTVMFNPVFLTSLITVITTFINLILLRKLNDQNKNINFFENVFTVTSFGIIYLALLLEIIYHISDREWIVIFTIALLFSLYYIFSILIFRKKLEINKILETGLIYLFLFLIIIHTSLAGSGIVNSFLLKKTELSFYTSYLLHWLPFIYLMQLILPKSEFFNVKFSYWFASFAFIIAVSFEFFHLYILLNTNNILQFSILAKHFRILYLPIIWAILASIFIYKGLKNETAEYNKIGFVLIAIMILKLYAYDVWEMDNISRITAFIILGIILLLSSFLFQRVKKIIKNLVENKTESSETENQKTQ